MNARTQLSPTATRSTFPVEYVKPTPTDTVDAYLDRLAATYRASCYLSDLTCARVAAVALCREVSTRIGARLTYKAARRLLAA